MVHGQGLAKRSTCACKGRSRMSTVGVSKSVMSLTHATGHSDWYAFKNCLHGA